MEANMRSKSVLWAKTKKQLVWYSFLIVSIINLIVLVYWPMITTVRYSFYEVSMLGFGESFVGIHNYRMLIYNPVFMRSVRNTLILTAYSLLTIPLGFILASLINSIKLSKLQAFFRVGFYLPNIITGVSVILVFQMVLRANGGLLNNFLSFFTRNPVTIGWLSNSSWAQFGVSIIAIWGGLGYSMLINLASLQSIPSEIYEAAEVDGAGPFQSWRAITIPQMTPCFVFLFITGVIGGLARFTDLFILSGNNAGGRPAGVLQTLMMFIYMFSFESPNFGVASAGAVILFLFTLIVTLVNLKVTGFFKKNQI